MRLYFRHASVVLLCFAFFTAPANLLCAVGDRDGDEVRIADLANQTLSIRTPTRSQAEYQKALESYRRIQKMLTGINRERLDLDNQVDYDLLDAGLKIRIWQLEKIRSYEVDPESYLDVFATSELLLRLTCPPSMYQPLGEFSSHISLWSRRPIACTSSGVFGHGC